MAASPLGSLPSPERKLVELLDEKQEPFLLDIYLLENAYVKRSMEAEMTTICFPYGKKKKKKKKKKTEVQRLASHGFNMQREGNPRSMLAVLFLRGRGNKTEESTPPQTTGTTTTTSQVIKSDRKDTGEWEFLDDPKQHSPVSVLEVQSEGSGDSPVHEQFNRGESSTSTAELQQQPQKTLRELLMAERNGKISSWRSCKWRKRVLGMAETFRLVEEDVKGEGEWNGLKEQKRRIEEEIGDAIFEEVLWDSLLEFLF